MTEGGAWADVIGFLPLCRAAKAASRGKKLGPDAQAFLADLEPNVLALQRVLADGSWRPGTPTTFRIRDPKPRLISAAPFCDRVVHHAVCAVVGPVLEAAALDSSHACRTGRGTKTALTHAHQLVRSQRCYFKLDVRHYFETIDHGVVLACFQPHVCDDKVLDLLTKIVAAGAPGSRPGCGMPIGNLTSQHFANLVLTEVDKVAVGLPGVAGYVRYMDDMLLFGDAHLLLVAAVTAIDTFVVQVLHQQLKPSATRHGHCCAGVPFLGLTLFPGIVRLDPARRKRFLRAMAATARALADSTVDQAAAARSAAALVGWSQWAQTTRLRRFAQIGSEG